MFLPFDRKRYFKADTLLHTKVCFIISFNANCVRPQLRFNSREMPGAMAWPAEICSYYPFMKGEFIGSGLTIKMN